MIITSTPYRISFWRHRITRFKWQNMVAYLATTINRYCYITACCRLQLSAPNRLVAGGNLNDVTEIVHPAVRVRPLS